MTELDGSRLELHSAVLADMAGSRPKRLVRAMEYQAEDISVDAQSCANESDFRHALLLSASDDRLIDMWRKQLTRWDFAEKAAWSTTSPRTDERRAEIYRILGLEDGTAKLLEAVVPIAKVAQAVVISEKFVPWYTPASQQGRPWYWPSYRKLLEQKKWPEEAIAGLDAATDSVVERLADPTRADSYQSKGLVVGYVQSGKTANFTGVIAKAVDAGYRLVIVLGGTLNLLRAQTQRRLDMELVGRENILRGAGEFESDYADDPAWSQGKFIEFGALPSTLSAFDIVRMTTRYDDYKSLLQGIVALEFEKREPALPLYDPRNLHRASARLMVVKKNKAVLTKLVKDLRKIKTPLAEIPVLIIDDESDEASVNTSRSKSRPDADRTAINQKIADLLTMLPRAQYVGYTATPYANVFIDPSDTADIFPKDFIVSLPRPEGYMGASDFHDLYTEITDKEKNYANSNEKAHVRDVTVEDEDDTEALLQAIDMFVLTAAVKLFREDRGGLGDGYFDHHTMLIHESSWVEDHRDLRGRVTKLWFNAGYAGSSGHARLRSLFEDDIARVSGTRAPKHLLPASYEEVMPYVGPAVFRIGGDQKPIIVVNGDKELETGEADFDRRSIWKILIGGQKALPRFHRRRAHHLVLPQACLEYVGADADGALVRVPAGISRSRSALYRSQRGRCRQAGYRPLPRVRSDLSRRGGFPPRADAVRGAGGRRASDHSRTGAAARLSASTTVEADQPEQDVQRSTRRDRFGWPMGRTDCLSLGRAGPAAQHQAVAERPGFDITGRRRRHVRIGQEC